MLEMMQLSDFLHWMEVHPNQYMVRGAKVPSATSQKGKELAKKQASRDAAKQATQEKASQSNQKFAQQQQDYDEKYNTQSAIAQKAGSGREHKRAKKERKNT